MQFLFTTTGRISLTEIQLPFLESLSLDVELLHQHNLSTEVPHILHISLLLTQG